MKRKMKTRFARGFACLTTGIIALSGWIPNGLEGTLTYAETESSYVTDYGIKEFNGHYYLLFDKCMTWTKAKEYCEFVGGHLVCITSEEEQEFIESFLQSENEFQSYWLGAYIEGGVWSWLTGEDMEYTHWAESEPNGYAEDFYMQMYSADEYDYYTGEWDDTWNDGDHGTGIQRQGFICEWNNVNDIVNLEKIQLKDCQNTVYEINQKNTPEMVVQRQKAQVYNPKLAYTLSILASGAYDYQTAQDNLSALWFSRTYFNDEVYRLTWEQEMTTYLLDNDKVGYGIGQMELENGDLLVLVVIRGTFAAPTKDDKSVLFWGNEWQSDYNIVKPTIFGSGEHTGFANAERDVMADLDDQMGGIKTENVKYVVTGHSRGAAVANLLEKELMDRGVSGDDVYGYNFACPDVAKEYASSFNPKGKYNNIYNICIAGDPVSIVPGILGDGLSSTVIRLGNPTNYLKTWGKYGQSGWFCRDWNTYLSYDGTNLTFDKHRSENYVDMMSNRYSFSKTKSWIEYKANVLTSMLSDTFKNKSSNKSNIKVGKSSFEIPYNKSGQFLKDLRMCKASFHCPVDVEIVNSEGVVLASVIGDEVTYSDNAANDLQVLVMKDGDEKYFTVIGNEDYHFNLTGTDTGEMTAIISVQPACLLQSPTVTYYENVPLTAGKQMSLEISSDLTEYGESMTVYDESGAPAETIVPDIEEQSKIYGDLNQDNDLTVADVVLLARMVAEDADVDVSEDAVFLSDVNRDGILTSADTSTLLNLLTCKLPNEQ